MDSFGVYVDGSVIGTEQGCLYDSPYRYHLLKYTRTHSKGVMNATYSLLPSLEISKGLHNESQGLIIFSEFHSFLCLT